MAAWEGLHLAVSSNGLDGRAPGGPVADRVLGGDAFKGEASHAGAGPLYELEVSRHEAVKHCGVVLQVILQGQLLTSAARDFGRHDTGAAQDAVQQVSCMPACELRAK